MQVAAWQQDRTKCPQCGGDPVVCGDAEKAWYPQRTVCYSSMEAAAANAKYRRLHEERGWHNGAFTSWAEKPSDEHPYPADAGVSIWVSEHDLAPEDKFLSE